LPETVRKETRSSGIYMRKNINKMADREKHVLCQLAWIREETVLVCYFDINCSYYFIIWDFTPKLWFVIKLLPIIKMIAIVQHKISNVAEVLKIEWDFPEMPQSPQLDFCCPRCRYHSEQEAKTFSNDLYSEDFLYFHRY